MVASTCADRPVKASRVVPDAVRHLTPLVCHEKKDSGGQRDFAGWEGVKGAQFGGDIPFTCDLGMEGENFDHLLANAEKWWAAEGGKKSTSKASPHTQRRSLTDPQPSPLKRARSASPSMRPGVGPSPLLLPGGTQAVPMVGGAPSGSTSGRSSSISEGKEPGRRPKITASPSAGGGSEQAIGWSPSDQGLGSQGFPDWRMKLQKGTNGWAVVVKGGVADRGEQPPGLSLGPSSPQQGPMKRPYCPPAEPGLEAEGSTHGAKAFLPSPKKRPQSRNGDYPPGVSAQTPRKEGPRTGPCWLEALLALNFFQGCKNHNSESSKALAREKECNLFCTDCAGGPICMLCLEGHKEHRVVQIRRISFNDCVRISDIQRLLDYWQVQVYTINGAKVVFLNERPHSNPNHGESNVNACDICGRCLVDNVRFCSVGCKLACIKQGASEDAALTLQPFQK